MKREMSTFFALPAALWLLAGWGFAWVGRRGKKWMGVVLVLGMVGAAIAPSEKTHVYVVEYQRAPESGVPQFDVTLYDPADRDKADAILRAHVELMARFHPPKEDVLCSAWDAQGKKIGESLRYDAKEKKIR